MLRKLFLVGILQFIKQDSPEQILVAMIFTILYSSGFAFFSPFEDISDDVAMTLSQLEIFFVALIALLLKSEITPTIAVTLVTMVFLSFLSIVMGMRARIPSLVLVTAEAISSRISRFVILIWPSSAISLISAMKTAEELRSQAIDKDMSVYDARC